MIVREHDARTLELDNLCNNLPDRNIDLSLKAGKPIEINAAMRSVDVGDPQGLPRRIGLDEAIVKEEMSGRRAV